MSVQIIALFVLIGLVLGSFGSVLVDRLPAGKSIGGRSRCPRCHIQLRWFELFPVLSYVALGGQCGHCEKPIPARYPLLEIASAILFGAALYFEHMDPGTAVTTALVLWALLLITIIDAQHKRIPDLLTGIVCAAALVRAMSSGMMASALWGVLLCAGWFGAQWVFSRGRWVGSGDVLLAGALGAWLGIISSIGMLLLAYVLGVMWVLAMLLSGRAHMKKGAHVAFGPFLAVSAVIVYFGGMDWYLKMIF
jgi:leader peptidase (prepilin peptidase) / N-methyltransferase